MEILVALAATVPVLVVVALVMLAVRGDGYGRRTPPASRSDWSDGQRPSRAYREG
jgi:hypothetical protein